jgi:4-alpha-glucanotransferase
VLHFAFGADPGAPGYRPEHFPKNSVVYTGTHDNDTTQGWFNGAGSPAGARTEREAREEQAVLLTYLGTDGREIHWDLIRHAWMSAADTAIVPMQDLLGLGSDARMNVPATVEGNWSWRLREAAFDDGIAERLARLTKEAGRWPSRRS